MHKILQLKKHKEVRANNNTLGTGIKGYMKREVQTPLTPHQYIPVTSFYTSVSSRDHATQTTDEFCTPK